MSTRKRTTLSDVAVRAGVSPITVSRVLRRPDTVSADTRSRVEAIVRELGYRPDPAARALATGHSDVVGVLIPSITNAVFSEVLRGIYDEAERTRLDVQLANTRYSASTEEGLLALFLTQRPAAMIVAGFDQSPRGRDLLGQFGCPVVQIMETGADPVDMVVGFSHRDAARVATEHLLASGYRNLGFLGARMDPRAQRRLAAFREVAEGAGAFSAARCATVADPSTVSLGAALFRDLLDRRPETDAVFCVNDDMALGALFEARRMGLSVPQRVGICGFNDLEPMAAAEPPVTSVRTHRYEMGRRAVAMLVDAREGRRDGPAVVDLGCALMARASTARRSLDG